MDALYALYNRLRFSEGEFQDVVGPMFKPETTGLLIQLYQWLQVSPTDIDDGKYLMLKRLSEVSCPCFAQGGLLRLTVPQDGLQSWSTPRRAAVEHT